MTDAPAAEGLANDGESGGDLVFGRELVSSLPGLSIYARSLTRNPDSAQDLVQLAALKAWQARETFEPGTNMRAWLNVILRNTYFSDLRRPLLAPGPIVDLESCNPSCSGGQEEAALLADTIRDINCLPVAQRRVLLSVVLDGEVYEDLARVFKCAPGTIKSRVARARESLRKMSDDGRRGTPRPPVGDAADTLLTRLSRMAIIWSGSLCGLGQYLLMACDQA
jgi:RNA polymerase sigma-70 factor (ECF subfamily)